MTDKETIKTNQIKRTGRVINPKKGSETIIEHDNRSEQV
jgi:hypothetical protein